MDYFAEYGLTCCCKYKPFALIFLSILCAACVRDSGHHASADPSAFTVVRTDFPLRLGEVDFDKKENHVGVSSPIQSRIKQVVDAYYRENCASDSLVASQDVYLNTIQLGDSLQTVFLVLLKHYPTDVLHAKVLFYNKNTSTFIGDAVDLNLFALYDIEAGKIKPGYLKGLFEIDTPELERLDYNSDGVMDYRLTRLFHNGTFNALQTCILSVAREKIDTLYFQEKGLGEFAPE